MILCLPLRQAKLIRIPMEGKFLARVCFLSVEKCVYLPAYICSLIKKQQRRIIPLIIRVFLLIGFYIMFSDYEDED